MVAITAVKYNWTELTAKSVCVPLKSEELWCTRATLFVYVSFPSYPVVFCEGLVPVHPSGVCVHSYTCGSACLELALVNLCNQQSSVINMWVDPSCVPCSSELHLSLASGLFTPHPWFYCLWCSPLAFAHFLVGFFFSFAHMRTHLGCSTNNSSTCRTLPTLLLSPSFEVSSSSVTSALSLLCLFLHLDSCFAFKAQSHLGLFSGFRIIK